MKKELINLLIERFGSKDFHDVWAHWASFKGVNHKNPIEGDTLLLLLMLCTYSQRRGTEVEEACNVLWRRETGKLIQLLVERVLNHKPDNIPALDIRNLEHVEVHADYVKFVYPDATSIAGQQPKIIQQITVLSGDFWRNLYLSI